MHHRSPFLLCRLPLAALAGATLLSAIPVSRLPAAPPPAEHLPSVASVVSSADRLALTDKGIAYRAECDPVLTKAVQKALRGMQETPQGKFVCDFVVVISTDGHVTQAIVAKDTFSIRLTDELRKMTLPKPPHDAWPLGIHWEIDLRKKS